MKRCFLLAVVLMAALLLPKPAIAATINATSCSQADVQSAVNVAQNGDTVLVPSGNCTWTTGATVAKNLSVVGAGLRQTLINGSGIDYCFSLDNAYSTRISGFGFTDCTVSAGGQATAGAAFRIDHNSFTSTGSKLVLDIRGNSQTYMKHPTGLIDNNAFNNVRVVVAGAAAMLFENEMQHQLWAQDPPKGMGTGVVYVEDNTFNVSTGNYLDGNYGARYVGRFNTITSPNAHMEVHSVQGLNRAVQWWELYETTITNSSQFFGLAFIRGGSGVVFGNHINSGAQSMMLNNVRSASNPGDPPGMCNGSSSWDQNTSGQSGYACRDQIGRCKDNTQWLPGQPYDQDLMPAYFWNNIQGASTQYLISIHGGGLNDAHIVKNRDFYTQNTSFDGTNGVGVGTIASRPLTCTMDVAYWATDEGEWNSRQPGPDGRLYKCSAPNNWSLYYTPYTYPHPLTLDDGSEIIPPDRRIDWSQAGIPGGIPNKTMICANVKSSPYNAYGDGIHDDTAALQQAIDACPQGQVVYLPEGAYKTSSRLSITKGIVLRGDGPSSRIMIYGANTGIRMGQGSGGVAIPLSGSHVKGSMQITIAQNASINAGQYIVVDELNPPIVDTHGGSYLCEDRSGGGYSAAQRCIAQIVRVTGRIGNTLTLERPLYFDYNSSLSPRVYTWSMVENAGLERLHIERAENTGGQTSNMIQIMGCSHCWVRDIETYKGKGDHIQLWFSYGNEIRENFLNMGHNDYSLPDFGYDSGRNYGIHIAWGPSSDHLIENNIINSTRHALVIEGPGSGNVFAYNYALNGLSYNDIDWVAGDASNHGTHPYMNLWEGNVIDGRLTFDYTHGSGSHNTVFRNRITRGPSWKTGGTWAVDIQQRQYYVNVVGNVLGLSGMGGSLFVPAGTNGEGIYRLGHPSDGSSVETDTNVSMTLLLHGNFDYVTNSVIWNSSVTNHSLPASLYLSSKPSWFGNVEWPPIGPDVPGYSNKIPAQLRFEAMAGQAYHRSDTNMNNCVEISELLAFIERWKISNLDVNLREIIEAIGIWKRGC